MKSLNGHKAVDEMAKKYFLNKDEIILVTSMGYKICVGDMTQIYFHVYNTK